MNPVKTKQNEKPHSVYKRLQTPVLKSKAKETWCLIYSGYGSSCWDGNTPAKLSTLTLAKLLNLTVAPSVLPAQSGLTTNTQFFKNAGAPHPGIRQATSRPRHGIRSTVIHTPSPKEGHSARTSLRSRHGPVALGGTHLEVFGRILQRPYAVSPVLRALAGGTQKAEVVAAEGGQRLAVHRAHALRDGRRRVQAPGHFCHFGERSVGSQVPLRRQLAALGARVRALGLAPAASDALAAEVVTAVGHHRVGEVIEADGTGGLLLEVGGQVWGGHGAGGSALDQALRGARGSGY